MITCRMRDDDLMEIKVEGIVTKEEYERTLPQVDKKAREREGLKFLIILENFKGGEPSVIWEDLKYDIKNRKRFGNMAILGEKESQRWLTKISNIIFPSEVRFFRKNELLEAMKWLEPQGPFSERSL